LLGQWLDEVVSAALLREMAPTTVVQLLLLLLQWLLSLWSVLLFSLSSLIRWSLLLSLLL